MITTDWKQLKLITPAPFAIYEQGRHTSANLYLPALCLGTISLMASATSASDLPENMADSFLTDTGDDLFLPMEYSGSQFNKKHFDMKNR